MAPKECIFTQKTNSNAQSSNLTKPKSVPLPTPRRATYSQLRNIMTLNLQQPFVVVNKQFDGLEVPNMTQNGKTQPLMPHRQRHRNPFQSVQSSSCWPHGHWREKNNLNVSSNSYKLNQGQPSCHQIYLPNCYNPYTNSCITPNYSGLYGSFNPIESTNVGYGGVAQLQHGMPSTRSLLSFYGMDLGINRWGDNGIGYSFNYGNISQKPSNQLTDPQLWNEHKPIGFVSRRQPHQTQYAQSASPANRSHEKVPRVGGYNRYGNAQAAYFPCLNDVIRPAQACCVNLQCFSASSGIQIQRVYQHRQFPTSSNYISPVSLGQSYPHSRSLKLPQPIGTHSLPHHLCGETDFYKNATPFVGAQNDYNEEINSSRNPQIQPHSVQYCQNCTANMRNQHECLTTNGQECYQNSACMNSYNNSTPVYPQCLQNMKCKAPVNYGEMLSLGQHNSSNVESHVNSIGIQPNESNRISNAAAASFLSASMQNGSLYYPMPVAPQQQHYFEFNSHNILSEQYEQYEQHYVGGYSGHLGSGIMGSGLVNSIVGDTEGIVDKEKDNTFSPGKVQNQIKNSSQLASNRGNGQGLFKEGTFFADLPNKNRILIPTKQPARKHIQNQLIMLLTEAKQKDFVRDRNSETAKKERKTLFENFFTHFNSNWGNQTTKNGQQQLKKKPFKSTPIRKKREFKQVLKQSFVDKVYKKYEQPSSQKAHTEEDYRTEKNHEQLIVQADQQNQSISNFMVQPSKQVICQEQKPAANDQAQQSELRGKFCDFL